jgi:2'-5' RNA ligase
MRAFIAIGLPQETKDQIAELEKELLECGLAFKWVRPGNLHLTLKFLGNVAEEEIPKIKAAIAKVASKFPNFNLSLEGFGFLPNQSRPKIFFIKTSRQNLLKTITEELEDELEKAGFTKEGRFKAHITLARIKDSKNIERLKERTKGRLPAAGFPAAAITFYKSTLTKNGPVYEEIFKSSLAA